MAQWTEIAKTSDCPPGSCLELIIENRIVALVCDEGEYYAVDGICPHQGGPLGQGTLAAGVLTCPWHGWQFNVRNGCNLANPNIVQPRLPVRVEQDVIYVDLAAELSDA
jgi:nitrite reductase/ring-hydroxylating ferredoxin subunit